MKPPKNKFLAESRKQSDKKEQFYRISLKKISYLPGHSAVSETDLLQRERLGDIPFRHGRQGFNSIIQILFLPIHPALGMRGRQIQISNH